jgi:hypothetical protein
MGLKIRRRGGDEFSLTLDFRVILVVLFMAHGLRIV